MARLVSCLVIGLLGVAALQPGAAAQGTAASDVILVVPFENASGDSRLQWVSEASALLLTASLERFGAAVITREERVRAFERLGLPRFAPLSDATMIRAGQLIGASHVVVARFSGTGGRLDFAARTIRLDAGRMPPDSSESGPVASLQDVMNRLARKLFPAGPAGVAADRPQEELRLPVFEAYVKGLIAETPAAQVRSLDAALALDPGYGPARIALWQVHTSQGEHERAEAAVSQMAGGGPLSRRARFLASLSSVSLQRYDAAFERLSALSAEGPAPTVFNNLGVIQLRRGKGAPGAAYYFTKAADLAPDDPDYAFNLGYAYWQQRDAKAAIYWLREAVRRDPADGHAHFVLGVALQFSGSTVEGVREKELARQLSSTYSEWERRAGDREDPVPRGLERLRSELDAPSLSLVERTAAPGERNDQRELAAFHAARGRRLFERQQDREAMAELRRSLYLSPYQPDVLLLAGRIDMRAGRFREASESFRVSLWCAETVEAHVALGEALLQLGDALGAQTEANRALTLDVNDAAARDLLERAAKK